MSTTHRVLPLTHKLDLPEYLGSLPHFGMAFNLLRMFINDCDFMTRQAVSAASKHLREEVFDLDGNETFNEIADAVKELELAEIAFFEAGNDRPSMLEVVQHIAELRPTWIEMANKAYGLHQGGRSTVSNLWAQEHKVSEFRPETIEEQFENPVFRVSQTKRERTHKLVIKKVKAFGLDDSVLEAKLKDADERLEKRAADGAAKFAEHAGLNIAIYNQMLRANVRGLRETDINGSQPSTDGNSQRVTHIAARRFETLPVSVRMALLSKSVDNADKWRGWQADSSISDDDWTTIDALTDRVILDLKSVLSSPAMTAAQRTADAQV